MEGKKKKHSIASIDTFNAENTTSKPESRLAKFGLGKLKRRSSLGKDKRKSGSDQLKNIDVNNAPFSITIQRKESPITPDKDLSYSPPPVPTLKPMSKSTSKSEDSLDSGIYSRQKSCDSMDSVGSATSNAEQHSHYTSFATGGGVSPNNETQRKVAPDHDYDMYWSEVHNIRESISHEDITLEDITTKARPVGIIRNDSGGDEDEDHEADWLRQAGLADLVTSSTSPTNSSAKLSGDRSSQVSTDSLSSMTVLSTLTRPQRAAVLRRITSFNRAQQTKRQPKPHIRAVFPDTTVTDAVGNTSPPVVTATARDGDVTIASKLSDAEISSKSASLPHGITGLDEVYPRRYSEIPRSNLSRMTSSDENLTTQNTNTSLHVMTVGNKSHMKKGDMDSIVAAGNSPGEMDHLPNPEGVESLSIRSRSTDDNSRWSANGSSGLHFADSDKSKVIGYSETANQEKLPTFSLVKDRLGITRVSDLSPPDVRKVQSLALIELTALFDLHGIELKRRKFGKTKFKDTGTFGVLLTSLLEIDQKRQNDPQLKVAYCLQEIVAFLEDNGLNDEGILRVPGSSVRIKNLKQELEERYTKPIKFLDAESGWGNARTNDVAALLKQFLRELPNPLLTTEYIDAFMSCELISERKQQLQALNLLILLLHTTHRDALKLILKFLSRVVAHEETNKMSLNNVAMIMAPNLFMGRKSSKRDISSAQTASQDVKHAAGTSNIVRMLIKYHKILWTVPTFMLTQVRNMNQAEQSSKKQQGQSKDKSRLKFLPGMSRSKEPSGKKVAPVAAQPFDYEVPKGLIRVQILNHTMTSMAIQVNSETTAREVIGKVTRQCEKAREMSPGSNITLITDDTHALYEVGGNINERCLDPGTNMHMLIKVNPEATWVIKKRLSH